MKSTHSFHAKFPLRQQEHVIPSSLIVSPIELFFSAGNPWVGVKHPFLVGETDKHKVEVS